MLRLKRSHPGLWLWKLPSSITQMKAQSAHRLTPKSKNRFSNKARKDWRPHDRGETCLRAKVPLIFFLFLRSLFGHWYEMEKRKLWTAPRDIMGMSGTKAGLGERCFYGVLVLPLLIGSPGAFKDIRNMYIIEYEYSRNFTPAHSFSISQFKNEGYGFFSNKTSAEVC